MGATRLGRTELPAIACTEQAAIPDKLYFKIGEVASLVGVEAHVLRYWEREVAHIRPGKSASNQRRYRRRDVELFREVRRLLYEEKYTLAGARRRLTHGLKKKTASGASKRAAAPSGEPCTPQDDYDDPLIDSADEFMPVYADAPDAPYGEPATMPTKSVAPQTATASPADPLGGERVDRLRSGLRELIRLAGESI